MHGLLVRSQSWLVHSVQLPAYSYTFLGYTKLNSRFFCAVKFVTDKTTMCRGGQDIWRSKLKFLTVCCFLSSFVDLLVRHRVTCSNLMADCGNQSSCGAATTQQCSFFNSTSKRWAVDPGKQTISKLASVSANSKSSAKQASFPLQRNQDSVVTV